MMMKYQIQEHMHQINQHLELLPHAQLNNYDKKKEIKIINFIQRSHIKFVPAALSESNGYDFVSNN